MANYMTSGYTAFLSERPRPGTPSAAAAKWGVMALARIRPTGAPDMVVGRPGAEAEAFEDDGRTLVLPVPASCPKLYACANETGGATLMLAEEY